MDREDSKVAENPEGKEESGSSDFDWVNDDLMIKCVACGHGVSRRAPFCPNCGDKTPGMSETELLEHYQATRPPTDWVGRIFGYFMFGSLAIMVVFCIVMCNQSL